MRNLLSKSSWLARFRLSERVATRGALVPLRRLLWSHGPLAALLAIIVAFSIPIVAVVALAAQHERATLSQIEERETGLGLLGRARTFERRLRMLRAHEVVSHRVALADRAQVERSLLRLEDAVSGAGGQLGLRQRLAALETAWTHVSDRRTAMHDVDVTLAAAAAFESSIAERASLSGEANDVVADAIGVYVDDLPTIDDRIDQDRNLIAGALAARRARAPTTIAIEIFERQWRRAYDTAIGSANQIRAENGSGDLLNALRRLGFAGSRFDAAARYAFARRARVRNSARLIARRADDVAREIDASARVAAALATRGYARRAAEEQGAFDHTLSLASLAWCFGLVLTLGTAYAVRRRERNAGKRLYGGVVERLASTQAQLQAVFEGSSLGVAVIDETGNVVRRNPALKTLLGDGGDALIGTADARFAACAAGAGGGFTIESVRDRDGKRRYLQSDVSRIRTEAGAPNLALAIVRDITDSRETEAKLRFEARHDPVSRLPNREYFFERLAAALAHGAGTVPAVAFLDIAADGSPSSLGYTGDEILAALAARLAGSVDINDFVARYDGSTFVVLLHALPDRQSVVAAVEKMLRRLGAPLALGERDAHVTAVAGIAVADRPYSGPAEIVRDAEIAMYAARSSGTHAALFAPEMRDRSARRLALVSQLRCALERDQLYLVFQPLVATATGTVRGFEALLRWEHPELGNVTPDEFIPLAEEVGCIDAIGRWVIDRGCAQLAGWRALVGTDAARCTIALNVAVRELIADDYAVYVTRTLARHALEPRDVVIEVTESAALRGDGAAARTLAALRATGVSLAIDDFGTGYSSLCYLHDFAFDQLKIDGSFVRGAGDGLASPAIVTMLVALAKTLGVEVVAEGVETAAQARALSELGVDTLQGFYFGKPIAAALVPDCLRAPRRNVERLVRGRAPRLHSGRSTA
jgi:diguanylate cyclase (GGDEF)-like protein/PAS domain S-box-containing protein